MPGNNLFTPKAAGTVNIAATVASANVLLNRLGQDQLRVKNLDATNAAFINFGNASVTASAATGMPVGPGETLGVTLAIDWTHAAAITGAATATVYFTPGSGL